METYNSNLNYENFIKFTGINTNHPFKMKHNKRKIFGQFYVNKIAKLAKNKTKSSIC